MALTTTVTATTIAVALGRSAPASDSPTELQWEMWISDALRFIQRRATDLEVADEAIDQDDLDYVIREAVVAQVKKPDDSTQVAVSVDDGSISKSFRSGSGRVTILGEWWELLGLAPTKGKAFMVDLMPQGAGLYDDPADGYWWWTP